MCGLAGYVGVAPEKRFDLIVALGVLIDKRGGHAAGYVGINERFGIHYAKRVGTWALAKKRFFNAATQCETLLMHSRYATSDNHNKVEAAHPFAIRRDGKVVLWGAHNGVILNAWHKAKNKNRDILVDSQELFHRLVDGDKKEFGELNGWGVMTWLDPRDRDSIYMVKLTQSGDIEAVELADGGVVYASRKAYIEEACEYAGLKIQRHMSVDKVGPVYAFRRNGVYIFSNTQWKINENKIHRWNQTPSVSDMTDEELRRVLA